MGTPAAIEQLNSHLVAQGEQLNSMQPAQSKRSKTASDSLECPTYHTSKEDIVYAVTVGEQIRKKLVIHTSPINPQLDISPTGRFELFIRNTEVEQQTRFGTTVVNERVACVYLPNGHCKYTMPAERAAWLQSNYDYMQKMHPQVMQRLNARTVAEEIYLLCERYSSVKQEEEQLEYSARALDQLALPTHIHYTLHYALGCTQERFASPLNVSYRVLGYYSREQRDQIFRADHDAYSAAWTGASVAFPDMTAAAASKATEWAIKSAACTDIPTLTVLILPDFGTPEDDLGYMKLVDDHSRYCYHMGTIPAKAIKLLPPCHARNLRVRQPKWGYHMILVGNVEGYRKFITASSWEQHYVESSWNLLSMGLIDAKEPDSKPITWNRNFDISRQEMWPCRVGGTLSKAFRRKRKDRQHTLGEQESSENTISAVSYQDMQDYKKSVETALATLVESSIAAQQQIPALRFDWRSFAYTDGSVVPQDDSGAKLDGPGIGAAVHFPTGTQTSSLTVHIACKVPSDKTLLCNMNTINRAELAAIHTALLPVNTPLYLERSQSAAGALHIATDSLGSIHQVHRMVNRPQDMTEHRHAHLIQQIVQLIRDAPGVVHLWKVKSHTGIIGNDRADRAAVDVAKGYFPAKNAYQCTVPSNCRINVYWPHMVYEEEVTNGTTGEVTVRTQYTPLATIHSHLKDYVHQVSRLGMADTDTVYFKAWQDISKKIDHRYSHLFLGDRSIEPWLMKKVMQYRYGLLPTQKYLHRIKKAPSDACPLCGQPDSGQHAISACPALYQTAILRHNAAGAAILQAVSQGGESAKLMLSDIGMKQRLAPSAITSNMHNLRLPRDYRLPTSMPAVAWKVLENSTSVPDLLIYSPYMGEKTHGIYDIVEIKYCRDTDPEEQTARATTQHAQLIEQLQKADPAARIRRVTLMLGVSGTIYKETAKWLEYLGVQGPALKRLLKALHYNAITYLGSMWKHRMALILKNTSQTTAIRTSTQLYSQQPQMHRKHHRLKKRYHTQ